MWGSIFLMLLALIKLMRKLLFQRLSHTPLASLSKRMKRRSTSLFYWEPLPSNRSFRIPVSRISISKRLRPPSQKRHTSVYSKSGTMNQKPTCKLKMSLWHLQNASMSRKTGKAISQREIIPVPNVYMMSLPHSTRWSTITNRTGSRVNTRLNAMLGWSALNHKPPSSDRSCNTKRAIPHSSEDVSINPHNNTKVCNSNRLSGILIRRCLNMHTPKVGRPSSQGSMWGMW